MKQTGRLTLTATGATQTAAGCGFPITTGDGGLITTEGGGGHHITAGSGRRMYFRPAWVVWMYNDDYCGWYPISPRIRCHHHWGWRCHGMRYKTRCWTFVKKKDFQTPITHQVAIDPGVNPTIIKTTKYDGVLTATNVGVKGSGPGVKEIETSTGIVVTKDDVTKYGTKNIEVKSDDNNKKKDDVNSVRENNPVKMTAQNAMRESNKMTTEQSVMTV